MRMIYSAVETPLGCLLLAATAQGICSLILADSEAEAMFRLRERFSPGDMKRNDDRLRPQTRQLLAYLNNRGPCPVLPLDVAGTAFQLQVWQELRRIPCGETISYSELAARIGRPLAVRAVARACGANPVAILTPCHRVVGKDGSLTGYRWGIERKRRLLEGERP